MSFDVASDGLVLGFPDRDYANRYCQARGLDLSSVAERDSSPSILALKVSLKGKIDGLANTIYSQFVATPGLLKEYQDAENSSRAWLTDMGQPTPPSVSSWAVPKNWTNEQAAEDILGTAAQLNGLMNLIRKARLLGKQNVEAANTQAQAVTAANVALAALAKIVS